MQTMTETIFQTSTWYQFLVLKTWAENSGRVPWALWQLSHKSRSVNSLIVSVSV